VKVALSTIKANKQIKLHRKNILKLNQIVKQNLPAKAVVWAFQSPLKQSHNYDDFSASDPRMISQE
jgi:hypothetical protein